MPTGTQGGSMSVQLTREVLESTYEDFRADVESTAASFVKRCGGEYDEALSEANEQFMEAWIRWTPNRGTFDKWLRYRVSKELLETRRLILRRRELCPPCLQDPDSIAVIPATFYLDDFIGGLSPDAAMILRMIFDDPLPLRMLVAERGEPSPINYRRAVREHLRDLGWDRDRINTSFTEIASALL